ncbi:MAG: YopX family protein [bacterium]
MNTYQREIEFRAKTNAEQWVFGSLVKYKTDYKIVNNLTGREHSVHENTIGQYIERKTIGGRRIYRGDILAGLLNDGSGIDYNTKFVVEWEGDGWNVGQESDNEYVYLGNIHDNPIEVISFGNLSLPVSKNPYEIAMEVRSPSKEICWINVFFEIDEANGEIERMYFTCLDDSYKKIENRQLNRKEKEIILEHLTKHFPDIKDMVKDETKISFASFLKMKELLLRV